MFFWPKSLANKLKVFTTDQPGKHAALVGENNKEDRGYNRIDRQHASISTACQHVSPKREKLRSLILRKLPEIYY